MENTAPTTAQNPPTGAGDSAQSGSFSNTPPTVLQQNDLTSVTIAGHQLEADQKSQVIHPRVQTDSSVKSMNTTVQLTNAGPKSHQVHPNLNGPPEHSAPDSANTRQGHVTTRCQHLFQSFKFQPHRPDIAEYMRTCSELPEVVVEQAHGLQSEVRRDWHKVNIRKMEETLWLKVTQYPGVKEYLLATGDAELIQDSPEDDFWGSGPDEKGWNELGKALERLRSQLRATASTATLQLQQHNAQSSTNNSISKPSHGESASNKDRGQKSAIYFYDKHTPCYGFTNFSPHFVIYRGRGYPTSQHLFQSFKFQKQKPDLAEHVRTYSAYPGVATAEAHRLQLHVRRDWNSVRVQMMEETLWHKFTQHMDLQDELIDTGDAKLHLASDVDSFWGIGPDGKGRNEHGKALERLRTQLRTERERQDRSSSSNQNGYISNARPNRSSGIPSLVSGLFSKRLSVKPLARERIFFFSRDQPHYGFSHFSPDPMEYKNGIYPTSEHLFQSFKFQKSRPEVAEYIRTFSELPGLAFLEAQTYKNDVRRDWLSVNIRKMEETLWHKFNQHDEFRNELLETGDAQLVADIKRDAFWGIGPDGRGRNELGKALERLRARLRK